MRLGIGMTSCFYLGFQAKQMMISGLHPTNSLNTRLVMRSSIASLPRIVTTENVPIYLFSSQEIEPEAMEQLKNLARSVIPVGYVSAMPDVHLGKGATVGSVFASEKYIAPNAIGVDIGCGMTASPFFNLKREHLTEQIQQQIFQEIKRSIPTGFNGNTHVPKEVESEFDRLIKDHKPSKWLLRQLTGEHGVRALSQLGSLGGGNHFIEVLYDESDNIWAMLHSGSRFIGKHTAEYYYNLAKKQMTRSDRIASRPTPMDLAYLEADSEEGQQYINDMTWCQHYAFANRKIMLTRMLEIIQRITRCSPDPSKRINIHHNFCERRNCKYVDSKTNTIIEKELWITRKGATSARLNEYGIIPGSMGVGSYIVRGKGNDLSWQSCSHGAGRLFSRTMAKKRITFEEFQQDMKGILHDQTEKLLDEAPKAYKPLEQVMKDQQMLVEVVHRLLPLINIKGY